MRWEGGFNDNFWDCVSLSWTTLEKGKEIIDLTEKRREETFWEEIVKLLDYWKRNPQQTPAHPPTHTRWRERERERAYWTDNTRWSDISRNLFALWRVMSANIIIVVVFLTPFRIIESVWCLHCTLYTVYSECALCVLCPSGALWGSSENLFAPRRSSEGGNSYVAFVFYPILTACTVQCTI